MDELLTAARRARENAHAPYSGFTVGAALRDESGAVYLGANVENASYGITNCAERVALGAAVVGGARRFTDIVVVTGARSPTAPCGACRQALSEFGLDLSVRSVCDSGESRSWVLRDLLPDGFGPEDLDR